MFEQSVVILAHFKKIGGFLGLNQRLSGSWIFILRLLSFALGDELLFSDIVPSRRQLGLLVIKLFRLKM